MSFLELTLLSLTIQSEPSFSLNEKKGRKERTPLSDIPRKHDTVFISFLQYTPIYVTNRKSTKYFLHGL